MAKKCNINTTKNKRKNKQLNTDRLLSIAAIVISMVALLISYNQYSLSVRQDNESKTAIWNGIYNKDKQEFSFTSVNSDIVLQHAAIYFPSDFGIGSIVVKPPDYSSLL